MKDLKHISTILTVGSFCFFLFGFSGCSDSDDTTTPSGETMPDVSIYEAQSLEIDSGDGLVFDLRLSKTSSDLITVSYTTEGLSAEPNVDFVPSTGMAEIAPNTLSTSIKISILHDELKEVDETVRVKITSASNAEIKIEQAIGLIVDNDIAEFNVDDGYITAGEQYGYNLAWGEEFDNGIDLSAFNFEIGDGCPDICGWGNNELEFYTDEEKNARTEDGKLIITATKSSSGKFESARITTQGKKVFKYGRMDIRAKLPIGQGIWPAIWMLGADINEVGWPACGEIDIMEYLGHQPNIAYGTAHWGPQGRGYSTYSTGEQRRATSYADNFHVFTLVWEENRMDWYIDETKFHTITPSDMRGEQYRFNNDFFLILNVAVGGNWPGTPDGTTVFPQTMEVDYIRVFQL